MKRILSLIIFFLILSGCGNKAEDSLTSYKEAVNNDDTKSLIDLVETEDGSLTEDEAQAYLKLIHEMYSEEEFSSLVDEEIERIDAKAKSGEIEPNENLGFEFLQIENDDKIKLIIPRYKIGLDLPSSTYTIKTGINDLTVENPHGNNYQEIGVYAPGIYEIDGTATKDTLEGEYQILIDFTKPQNERASITGNIYSFRLDRGYSNTTIKKVFVNGEEVPKNEEDMYSVKLDNNKVKIKALVDYQGKEVETEEVETELEYVGINGVPLEVNESKVKEAEEDNKADSGISSTLNALFDGTATGLSLTSSDAMIKKGLIDNHFADDTSYSKYQDIVDQYSEKGAKFEFSVPTTKKLKDDKDNFEYEVESELKKDGKTVDTLKFEMEFVKKNDKMLIKSVKEVK